MKIDKGITRDNMLLIEEYLDFRTTDTKRLRQEKIYATNKRVVGGYMSDFREIARTIIDSGYAMDFIDFAYDESLELVLIRGLVIAMLDVPIDKKMPLISEYLLHVDSWACIDYMAGDIKVYTREYYDYLTALLKQDNTGQVRYAIVALMQHFYIPKGEFKPSIADILSNILNIEYRSYYIDMAVSWAITEAVICDRSATLTVLKACSLPSEIVRYTTRKLKDSSKRIVNVNEVISVINS